MTKCRANGRYPSGKREILEENAMRGYFTLKAAFVRLDMLTSRGLSPAFDEVFLNYLQECCQIYKAGRKRRIPPSRVMRLMGHALCKVADLAKTGVGSERL